MAYEPFYIANQQMEEENWEAQEEKDFEYMKEMYPQIAKDIQGKVEEECDKLEYDGSIMFDEYPDKTLIRAICDRIYDQMGENQPTLYVEDEEDMENEMETEAIQDMLMAENRCRNCGRPPQGPNFPPPRPPQRPNFPPPRPPQGPNFPPPRPPQGPNFPPPRPPQGPNFPPPCSPQRPGCSPRWWVSTQSDEKGLCVPGRPKRDCFTAMQTSQDWMRDMIQVLFYHEMHRRRNRHRRRKHRRNY